MSDLFDPTTVPPQVVSAKGVAHVNDIVKQLRVRQAEKIIIQEAETQFRVSNMARAYAQAHLWRCVELIEAGHNLVYSGRGLVVLMAVRAIYETVAAFIDFENKIQTLFAKGDIGPIHDFVHSKSFSTRLPNLIEKAGTPAVEATSILTQIDKMKKVYPNVRTDYDYLCEHTHPNTFGAFLYYGMHDKEKDIVVFNANGPDPHDNLKWVLVGGNLLGHFLEAFDRLEKALPAISELGRRQKPSATDEAGA